MSSRHVATAMDLYMLSDSTSKYIEEQVQGVSKVLIFKWNLKYFLGCLVQMSYCDGHINIIVIKLYTTCTLYSAELDANHCRC